MGRTLIHADAVRTYNNVEANGINLSELVKTLSDGNILSSEKTNSIYKLEWLLNTSVGWRVIVPNGRPYSMSAFLK